MPFVAAMDGANVVGLEVWRSCCSRIVSVIIFIITLVIIIIISSRVCMCVT